MRRTTSLALFKTGIVVTALYYAGNVPATPAVGFAATTIMSGTFGEIDLTNKSIVPDSSENDRQAKAWLSQQKTAGPSDSTSRAMCGSREELPAGTLTLEIA